MPYRDPDPADPHELVGVSIPGDLDSTRQMAATFADEFAALGFTGERLLEMFRRPRYAGAHRAYRMLGEEEVRRIIDESLELWGRVRFVVRDSAPAGLVRIGSRTASRPSDERQEGERCQK